MPLLEMRQFSYTYPGETQPVLKDINLSMEAGTFAVILGKSGSGKSTLGKALAGFLFQDETPNYGGEIIVNGADMSQLPTYLASERVAYVQQNPEDQFCTLTVQDEIAFGLENNCIDSIQIEKRIDEVLQIVKGQELKHRTLTSLSGGEKQKIAIASMLALSPDVLILDEPTSNLDPIPTKHVFETLYQIRENSNLTVIIIEHKLSQLLPFKPVIYEIEDGRLNSCDAEHVQNQIYTLLHLTKDSHIDKSLSYQDPLLTLSHISVARDGKTVLDGVDLTFRAGEFAAIMGPNGSGKSTLLETIMGFHTIQEGTFSILNYPNTKIKISDLIKDVGYIFQNPDHQLFTQSVWDETVFTSKNLSKFDSGMKTKAENWLTKMGLGDRLDAHPQRLSYGEKRRLNLISVMLHSPKILLIDELLIGQDFENAYYWMSILYDYAKNGNAVILVNHHPELTNMFCDRIIFLDEGHILVDKPVSQAFDEIAQLGYTPFLPVCMGETINA
jgi:energy-coupling factor transport system ATP-binding protein